MEEQHRSLNIIHAQNAQIYTTHLKHNSYTAPLHSTLREKLTDEDHTQADLFLKRTNLQISLPIPISDPFYWEIETDPCLELLQEKGEFNRKLESYRILYKKDKKKLNWKAISKEKLLNLPKYAVDLVINGDRNPYFSGTYDWFYARGNLEIVDVHNSSLLLSTHGQNIKSVNLSNFTQQDFSFNLEAPIYNIRGFNASNQSFIALRTKKCIDLVQLDFKSARSFEVTPQVIYKACTGDGAPYIDAVLFDDKLITANVAYEVDIHNIESKKNNYQRKFELVEKKGDLCQLEVVSNCLLFMARDYISLLDFRRSSEEKERRKNFKEGYFKCNELCAICNCVSNENFVYIASKHSVFKVDLREMAVVKTWTHLLDNSPILIKSMMGKNDGEEYVFVATCCETVCIHVSSSNHFPFKVSDIAATYNQLKQEHEFLIREDCEERFKLSLAGMATYESSVFTSNGIGDVFQQHVLGDDEDLLKHRDAEAIEKLKNYIYELPSKPRQLRASHFKELSAMRNIILKKHVDQKPLRLYTDSNPKLKKFLTPEREFGKYDMSIIWSGEHVAPLDETATEDQHKARIDTWLAQSAVEKYEPFDEEDNDL